MDKMATVAGTLDHSAGRLIDFPTLQRPALGVGLSHAVNSGVTCGGNNIEDLSVLIRCLLTDKSDARQVTVDGAWTVELRPQVDQDKIALLDGGVAARAR